MLIIVLFCVPFLPALGLTLFLLSESERFGAAWAELVGLGIAACFFAFAGAKGWLGAGPAACGSDGCWIDSMRQIVEEIVGVSLGIWLLGVVVGAAVHFGLGGESTQA